MIRNTKILKYTISVLKKFNDYYDLENTKDVVEDFLNKERYKYKPARPVLMKCGFVFRNIQPFVTEKFRPLLNTRC